MTVNIKDIENKNIAILYRGKKNPMQSGIVMTQIWFLDFIQSPDDFYEYNYMNWNGINGTSKVSLKFTNKENAVKYLERQVKNKKIDSFVELDNKDKIVFKKSYCDNFK